MISYSLQEKKAWEVETRFEYFQKKNNNKKNVIFHQVPLKSDADHLLTIQMPQQLWFISNFFILHKSV